MPAIVTKFFNVKCFLNSHRSATPACSDCINRLQPVNRASYAVPSFVQDMGIDHRRFDILVAEKFLDGADAVAGAFRLTKPVK